MICLLIGEISMRTLITSRNKRILNNGFSLVELIVVIAIIAILASVTVPYFICYIEMAKKEVCNANCLQVERMYETYLVMEELEHSDVIFIEYLYENGENICPDHGDITYLDGKVQCSKHDRDNGSESDDDGDVPFLWLWLNDDDVVSIGKE